MQLPQFSLPELHVLTTGPFPVRLGHGYLTSLRVREAVKKKIAEKETLVHMGGRGVKKSPFFSSSKRGHILMEGEVKSFCPMSHVHFCVSVSTQFVAFLEALNNVNFLYHVIKYLT